MQKTDFTYLLNFSAFGVAAAQEIEQVIYYLEG